MSYTLKTERLILRGWQDEDFEHFARMNADHLVMEYMPRILKEDDSHKLKDRFIKHFKKHGYGIYVMQTKADEAFAGVAGLNKVEIDVPFKGAVEIAWRLDYGYWGKGYASEAGREVLRYAFEHLKLDEVVAFAVHDNTRAIHLIEKFGMSRDENGDFDYPGLTKDHPLGRFVLYRLTRDKYIQGMQ